MGTMKKTTRPTKSGISSPRTEYLARKIRTTPSNPNGDKNETFTTGAKRSPKAAGIPRVTGTPDFTLICPSALAALGRTMFEGGKTYGKHNWTKGIPNSNSLNHALSHLQAYLAGDRSEDHLGHAMANIHFIIHFNHRCKCAEGFELLEATNKGNVQPLKEAHIG